MPKRKLQLDMIYLMDCLDGMKLIPDKSIDCIICDLPYGTTACAWDSIIPFDKLWAEYNRIIKDNGAIVLFGQEPFSSCLRLSNLKMYRYDWVWEKSKSSGYLNAKKQPLRAMEYISVFYKKQCTYNPQMSIGVPYNKGKALRSTEVYGRQKEVEVKSDGKRYPRSVIYFVTAEREGKLHPTQKPIALIEYLIRTYSNEGDIILDNCIGSGTTAIAAIREKRHFIGFECDRGYFDKALKRIEDEKKGV